MHFVVASVKKDDNVKLEKKENSYKVVNRTTKKAILNIMFFTIRKEKKHC